MGAFLKFLPKLIPLLPQLIGLGTKLAGIFKKKHDPKLIEETTEEEVAKLKEIKATAEEEDWKIVKGED